MLKKDLPHFCNRLFVHRQNVVVNSSNPKHSVFSFRGPLFFWRTIVRRVAL